MNAVEHMSLSESLLTSLLGFVVVFVVLILISLFIMLVSKVMNAAGKKIPAAPAAEAPAASAPNAPTIPAGKVPAPGSLGEIKLFDVEDKTAAMLMAIVADQLQTPLNELRFISIKERKIEK